MSELFLMLANRVEQLEQENQELREKLEQK